MKTILLTLSLFAGSLTYGQTYNMGNGLSIDNKGGLNVGGACSGSVCVGSTSVSSPSRSNDTSSYKSSGLESKSQKPLALEDQQPLNMSCKKYLDEVYLDKNADQEWENIWATLAVNNVKKFTYWLNAIVLKASNNKKSLLVGGFNVDYLPTLVRIRCEENLNQSIHKVIWNEIYGHAYRMKRLKEIPEYPGY